MVHYKKHLHIRYTGRGVVSILIRVYDLDGTVLAVTASRYAYEFIEAYAEENRISEGQAMIQFIEDIEKELKEYE